MQKRHLVSGVIAAMAAAAILAACGSGEATPFADEAIDGSTNVDGSNPQPGLDGGFGFDGSFNGDATRDVGSGDGALFSDAPLPDVVSDACTSAGDAGIAPLRQRCAPATTNECLGATDTYLTGQGVVAGLLNGASGNGYDDDCDGLVDEGCACPGNGVTKDCYSLPATQASGSTLKPVGWCTDNSKGSLDCSGVEFPKWSGTCRGGQPPYKDDICALGDFNCDGVQQNSATLDCTCRLDNPVVCPTAPITRAPYPNPSAIQIIDGSLWVDPQLRTLTTGWTWTVIGGDCDNVLPNPTYAIYNQTNSAGANARRGARTPVRYDGTLNPPRYVSDNTQKLISIQAAAYGNGVAGGQIYPAFGLSGDYIVQGEFDLQGKKYVCTQKVNVRAPGVRAELCWDTVGGAPLLTPSRPGTDVDLHFARLQGLGTACTTSNGWDTTCTQRQGPNEFRIQDCYYHPLSGCADGSTPTWGYANSPDSACKGWSSMRSATSPCTNPRLDKDNIICDANVTDPTAKGNALVRNGFCGPENINLDNPNNGDRFAVGVNFYGTYGVTEAKPHVNVYCNGQRVLSVGYDPVGGQTFPRLTNAGEEATGDIWNVATVKTNVTNGQVTSCDVETIPSHVPDPTRDGPNGTQLCVETKKAGAAYTYQDHRFVDRTSVQLDAVGTIPTTRANWCKH